MDAYSQILDACFKYNLVKTVFQLCLLKIIVCDKQKGIILVYCQDHIASNKIVIILENPGVVIQILQYSHKKNIKLLNSCTFHSVILSWDCTFTIQKIAFTNDMNVNFMISNKFTHVIKKLTNKIVLFFLYPIFWNNGKNVKMSLTFDLIT